MSAPRKIKLPSLENAREAASSDERWRVENEIRDIRKRGWLRENLKIDPTDYARRALVLAVERGRQEDQAILSQAQALDSWKKKADIADNAANALHQLTKFFSVADLWTLAAKRRRWRSPTEGRREAMRFHKSLVEAREQTKAIAEQSNEMARGVAMLKANPGSPFLRGFVLEMMKTWWLLTGRIPSSKRSEVGNPFVNFADAALQSICPDTPDVQSCVGVVRSVLPEFKQLVSEGAFDGDLNELTGRSSVTDHIAAPTKPSSATEKR